MEGFHDFTYGYQNLSDFGAVITQRPQYESAVRDAEFASIPYHSGDVYIDNGRYNNVNFTVPVRAVPAYCDMPFDRFACKFLDWLKPDGYKKYSDTYFPGYFRKAAVVHVGRITAVKKDVYETTVEFNAQPFMYRENGAETVEKRSSTTSVSITMYNPEEWESEPIITLKGTGSFQINVNGTGISAVMSDVTTLIIDKTKENFLTTGNVPCNDIVSARSIPYLQAGENTITVTRAGTSDDTFSVEVIPNWRRL